MADKDDPWGVPSRAERPLARGPAQPAANPHKQRMAEIAWDAAHAKKSAVDPARIAEATGEAPPAPKVVRNSDGSYTIANVTENTFFSPGQPLQPLAQDPDRGAVGRRFDYPVGVNLRYTPRAEEYIGFSQLRLLADNLDVLRLVIETRKDQMEALDWGIKFRDKEKDSDDDPGIEAIEEFLRYPDREHSYSEWQRAILEDLFVIDAPCVYPRPTNDGSLYSLELMNGALIIPRLDATGRRPDPPDVAYQQILKGIAAVDYSAADLIYRPRNVRTHKIYGFSPVEQIIITVNIALRRQQFQLSYYTEGSIPDAFGMVPDTWTPAMIAEYQLHWDALFENINGGNSGERRKMRWIPGAKDVKFSKEAILKDEFDEWLARIVCYAFSVEPTPFIKQVNRSTAGNQKEQSRSEGLQPLKKWWKSFMDYILVYHFKRPDLQFMWDEEDAVDPVERSQIDVAEIGAGLRSVDEVREERGLDPLGKPLVPPGQAPPPGHPDYVPPPPKVVAPGAPAGPAGNKVPDKAAAPAALRKVVRRLGKQADPNRRAVMIQTQRLTRAVKRQLRAQARLVIEKLGPKLGKATPTPEQADAMADDELEGFNWRDAFGGVDFVDDVTDPLQRTAADAAEQGFISVGVAVDKDFVDAYSVTDARDRGAELVGKKWVDDELVDNPNAEWVITDETRAGVRDVLSTAIRDGWSNDRFAAEIEKSYAFSPQRAEVIARTETAYADSRGHMAGWKASGLVEKVAWLTAEDDLVSDECAENGDAGPQDIGSEFPSGDTEPPSHPNCRCALAPVVVDDGGEETDDNADDEDLAAAVRARMRKHVARQNQDKTAAAIEKLAVAVTGHKTDIVINVPDQPTPNVTVAPAAINVDVHMPKRGTVEKVVAERDTKGLVKRTIEREIDE